MSDKTKKPDEQNYQVENDITENSENYSEETITTTYEPALAGQSKEEVTTGLELLMV